VADALVQDGQDGSYFATACGHLTADPAGDRAVGFYVDVDDNLRPWTMTRTTYTGSEAASPRSAQDLEEGTASDRT